MAGKPKVTRILQRLYDPEIDLYTPYRKVKRLLQNRIGTTDGTAHPGLEPVAGRLRPL